MIQRRVYIYVVAAATFAMVLIGLINLGSTAINQLLTRLDPFNLHRVERCHALRHLHPPKSRSPSNGASTQRNMMRRPDAPYC